MSQQLKLPEKINGNDSRYSLNVGSKVRRRPLNISSQSKQQSRPGLADFKNFDFNNSKNNNGGSDVRRTHSLINAKRLDDDFLDFGSSNKTSGLTKADLTNDFAPDLLGVTSGNNGPNITAQSMGQNLLRNDFLGNQGIVLRTQTAPLAQSQNQSQVDPELDLLTSSKQFDLLNQDVGDIEKNLFSKKKVNLDIKT